MNSINYQDETITPSKVVCIGRNYVAHIEELGNEIPDDMVVFLKPNSAISQQLHHKLSGEVLHYEGELCFLIQDNSLAAVGFGLDLTKRGLQSKLKAKGLPWERSKAFNHAALFSEFVHFNKVEDLRLELLIDGKTIQTAGTDLMMYSPQTILNELQVFMQLEDGDVIMTGTPKGVGEVPAQACFTGRVWEGETLLLEKRWTVSPYTSE